DRTESRAGHVTDATVDNAVLLGAAVTVVKVSRQWAAAPDRRRVVTCERLENVVNDSAVIPEDQWLAVPDIIELTGARFSVVKAWLQDREVVGLRRGPHNAVMVPASFLTPQGPVKNLRGTITVLGDSGLTDEEIIEWLHR